MTRRVLRRPSTAVIGLLIAVAMVLGLGATNSQSAFTAAVRNTANSTSITFSTCYEAVATGPKAAQVYFSIADTDILGPNLHNLGTWGNAVYYAGYPGWPLTMPRHLVGGPCQFDSRTQAENNSNGYAEFAGRSHDWILGRGNYHIRSGQPYTVQAWFKTTHRQGVLVAFGDSESYTAGSYVKGLALMMNSSGQVNFAVFANRVNHEAVSASSYADNLWHQATGVVYPGKGTALFIDGQRVANLPNALSESIEPAHLHIGFENVSGWAHGPSAGHFIGSMARVAFWNRALTDAEVLATYLAASGR